MATSATKRPAAAHARPSGLTPLGIVATFVALSETVAGLAAIKTEGSVQLIFSVFAISFPVFIAGVFFAILWKRSYVLYPPQEFGAEVDVRHYVEAMRHQVIGNQELHVLVRETISETLSSQVAQHALLKVTETKSGAAQEALQKASNVLVDEAVDRLQRSVITVDISAFEDSAILPELIFPYQPMQEAFSLLSAIYYQISDHVRPYTYGKAWALQDKATGNFILPDNVEWADNYALENSGVTVKQMGMVAGMSLQVVPLPSGNRVRSR